MSNPLPASFAKDGFTLYQRPKFRRLLVGTEGGPNTGKTEFALSAPGPGVLIGLDRNIDSVFDNPNPPETRMQNFAVKVIDAPLAGGATQDQFKEHWVKFRDTTYAAIRIPELRTCIIDGDSDSWELQRLAMFNKLTQIPSIMYTQVNAERRLFISRLHDSGRIIIATNKLKKHYTPLKNADGSAKMGADGKPLREWDGETYERQGFDDHEYMWAIQLRHLYNPRTKEWGIRFLMCKANRDLEGEELWGADCNFRSMVETVYPHIPATEWGYPA